MNWKFWVKKPEVAAQQNVTPREKVAQLVVGLRCGTKFVHTADVPRAADPFKDIGEWYERSPDARYCTHAWPDGGFFTLDREEITYMYTKEE